MTAETGGRPDGLTLNTFVTAVAISIAERSLLW